MKYELLIYAGSQVLSALDVDGERIQYISMLGNTEHSADDVNGFYEQLLDYYNVDNLSEIDTDIRIINGDMSQNNILFFLEKLKKIKTFSIWRIEELLPIVLINNNMIDKDKCVKVRVYDRCYAVSADEKFNVTVSDADNADNELRLEDFTLFNNFNGSDLKQDTELIEKLMLKISGLESVNDERNNMIERLKDEISSLRQEKADLKAELEKFIVKKNYSVGNVIEFGRYNGKPIQWRILKQNNGTVYVLCEEILCERVFAESNSKIIDCIKEINSNVWANSDLRKWLNGEFYTNAFNDEEKSQVISTDGDKITLLIKEEAETLLSKEERAADSWWWLRSPSPNSRYDVWRVGIDGEIIDGDTAFLGLDDGDGVRPAFNLKF